MDDERRIRDKDEAHGRTTGPVVKESFLESRMKPSKIEYGARQGGDAFILVALLSAPPCAASSIQARRLLETETVKSYRPSSIWQNILPQRYSVVATSPKIGKPERNPGPPKGEDPARMAAGTSRIVRYILFAFFGIVILYFVSSSSIPRSQLPTPKGEFTPKGSTEGPVDGEFGGLSESGSTGGIPSAPADVVPSAPRPVAGFEDSPTTPNPSTTFSATAPAGEKMNATFVTLARNSDLWEIVKSIRQVEDRFNRNYHYDWVFLNDKPFDSAFKKVTTSLISGKTHYEEIPPEHWSYPDFIDQEKARKVREDMAQRKIIYGDSQSYRHMCRFESGFFFRQPIMNNYEWYWRVEPHIELYCDVAYDPFKFMADNGKKYSFVISLYEYVETIPTLWDSAKTFMKKHPEHIVKGNAMNWVSDDGGESYNHCHFWSNFEIGNLNWLRSDAYLDFFNQLDQDGGFFYERWGDAPVHSIAAALTLKKEEIHFFNDIAYWHVPFTHCPTGEQYRIDHKCHCNPQENFDWKGYSCTSKWFDLMGMEKPEGWEDQR